MRVNWGWIKGKSYIFTGGVYWRLVSLATFASYALSNSLISLSRGRFVWAFASLLPLVMLTLGILPSVLVQIFHFCSVRFHCLMTCFQIQNHFPNCQSQPHFCYVPFRDELLSSWRFSAGSLISNISCLAIHMLRNIATAGAFERTIWLLRN